MNQHNKNQQNGGSAPKIGRDAEEKSQVRLDIIGLLLLSLGLILLVGILGLSHGSVMDRLTFQLARWFGWGRFLVVPALCILGLALLLWEKFNLGNISLTRLLAIELGCFTLLGGLSAIFSGNPLDVEAGKSIGGLVGYGMASLLVDLLGEVFVAVILILLTLLLFLYGLNLTGKLEDWAWSRLGESRPAEASEQATAPLSSNMSEASMNPSLVRDPFSEENRKTVAPHPLRAGEAGTSGATMKHSAEADPAQDKGQLALEFSDSPAPAIAKKAYDANTLPPLSLLDEETAFVRNPVALQANAEQIVKSLADRGVPVKVIGYREGPKFTQYMVEPGYHEVAGKEPTRVKISEITRNKQDLAMGLKAERLRIEAPVPGEAFVGVEIPNGSNQLVRLRPLLESEEFRKMTVPLAVPLGRGISGKPLVVDLAAMPHLLVAGTTKSGKSVCLAMMISSLVMNNTPGDLRLILIDPKIVGFSRFVGLPHVLDQVQTTVEQSIKVLNWACFEMDRRMAEFSKFGSRHIDDYNRIREIKGETKIPRIVIFIDELSDLMMESYMQTETFLKRLAAKARSSGISLVVATQRPSVDVFTGVIKANFPSRIAFAVASTVDSQVILDAPGAENLLGKGDMLLHSSEHGGFLRSQGVFISNEEIRRIVNWWKHQAKVEPIVMPTVSAEEGRAEALKEVTLPVEVTTKQPVTPEDTAPKENITTPALPVANVEDGTAPWDSIPMTRSPEEEEEGLVQEAIGLMRTKQRANTTFFSQKLRISFNRAQKLIKVLEERGLIGPDRGGADREIFLRDDELLQ